MEHRIDMIKISRRLKWVTFVTATCAALMSPSGQVLADPVIISRDVESSSSQEQTPPWQPGADNPAPGPDSISGRKPDTRSDQSGVFSTNPDVSAAPVRPAQSRSGMTNLPGPGTSVVPANGAQTQRDAEDQGFRDAVKDAIRPLHRDLSESGAAEAYRGLRSELELKKEQIFGHSEAVQGQANPGQGGSEANTWEGQGNKYGNAEPPRTAAQAERDKILASVMMDKLIDDAKPWLLGLIGIYALFYLIKFVVAFGKYQATRRYRRVQRHRRS